MYMKPFAGSKTAPRGWLSTLTVENGTPIEAPAEGVTNAGRSRGKNALEGSPAPGGGDKAGCDDRREVLPSGIAAHPKLDMGDGVNNRAMTKINARIPDFLTRRRQPARWVSGSTG
jgi:hypothetical protein